MKRSKALDSVRGIAILLVLTWHYLPRDAQLPKILLTSTGLFWSGVDLFFVLSGFLIGGILLQNVNSRKYFSTFYVRRAARIVPLYLLILMGFVIIIGLNPATLEEITKWHLPIWSYFTFTQNFLYASRQWFEDPWMDVTWSLAVEEQFYIFLSILIWKASRKTLPAILVVLLIMAPILRIFALNTMIAYLLPFHRADSLMLGVLLAMAWQSDEGRKALHKNSRSFQRSFIFLSLGVYYLIQQGMHIGDALGHFWLALFYCNFLLLMLIHNGEKKNSLFNNKILEWFGLRSYGIYLLHKPIQILIPIIFARVSDSSLPRWATLTTSIIVLFILSDISYLVVEKPIIALGHRFTYE